MRVRVTAVADTIINPLKAFGVRRRGVRTDGPMAPEIPLDGARPAVAVPEVPPEFELDRSAAE